MRLLTFAVLISLATTCTAAAPGGHKDLDDLQGEWVPTAIFSDGVPKKTEGNGLIFEKDILSFRGGGTISAMKWRIELTPTTSPKHIDAFPGIDSGAPPGTIIPCIYKLENRVMTLCMPQGNLQTMRRPPTFESRPGTKDVLFVLKRRAQ
jgi:uncharacterized protein (TIGR03067 family)